MVRVLGVSCSLRNARYGHGSAALAAEIDRIGDEKALVSYLETQTKLRLQDLIEAGLNDGRPFDEIHLQLRKSRTERGLSNSEAALVAGLWGARQAGAEITHCGLGTYFPMNGGTRDLDELRQAILSADAILLSGPVYFGDRGSLAQEFLEFIYKDPECAAHVRNLPFGGIAVGAKRNGGQETTLIYQLMDALGMNMLGVGNDCETTAQYGGTAVAGDVGTLHTDSYGIKTSIGTGRRLARVGRLMEQGNGARLADKVRIHIWLVQDTPDGHGRAAVERIAAGMNAQNPDVETTALDFTNENIHRCIACEICPTSVGPSQEYRCIINSDKDLFQRRHCDLIEPDAVLLAAYSPIDRQDLTSVYQRFTERTRYLRRDDYIYGDKLFAPLVISEIGSRQYLHIRMLTSFVRHHMVLHRPIIGMEHEGKLLNDDAMMAQAHAFAETAHRLTAGRLLSSDPDQDKRGYKPVGYIVSDAKRRVDEAAGRVEQAHEQRGADRAADRLRRVV